MNSLENRVANLSLTWVWFSKGFTTVHKDFGFVVYCRNGRNWLAVLSKETVKFQLECHGTKAPEITGWWVRSNSYSSSYTERMFEIEISGEFLVHVLESAFPEMLKEL